MCVCVCLFCAFPYNIIHALYPKYSIPVIRQRVQVGMELVQVFALYSLPFH